jgi:hypothetical protein
MSAPANSVYTAFLRTPGFNQLYSSPRDFDLDIACGGGIEQALEAAMALGPTSRALQDQGLETRTAVATSIRRALHINAISRLRLPGRLLMTLVSVKKLDATVLLCALQK